MSNHSDGRPGLILAVVGLAAAFVVVFYWWHMPPPIVPDTAIWGQFGDYVGGIMNPVVSLATLVAVLYTLRQNRDLINNAVEQARLASETLKAELEARAHGSAEEHSRMCLDAALQGIDAAVSRLAVAGNDRESWRMAAGLLADGVRLSREISSPSHLRMWNLRRSIHAARVRELLGVPQNTQRKPAFFFGGDLHQGEEPNDTLEQAVERCRRDREEGRTARHIEPRDMLEFCAICTDLPLDEASRSRGDLSAYLKQAKAQGEFTNIAAYDVSLPKEKIHGQ